MTDTPILRSSISILNLPNIIQGYIVRSEKLRTVFIYIIIPTWDNNNMFTLWGKNILFKK